MPSSITRHTRLQAIAAAFLALGWTHALATPAGLIEFVIGGVKAIGGDGRDRALAKGGAVESGDRVLTNDGRAHIRFTDGSYVSLAPNTDYLIKSYRYEGRTDGSEQGVFTLVKGAMRTVSGMVGRVNKSAYRLETPTATIGIRGTGGVIAILGDGGTLLTGTSGIWLLSNAAGTMEVRAGSTGYAGPNAKRAPERIADAAVLPVPAIGERPPSVAAATGGTGYVSAESVQSGGVPSGIDAVIIDGMTQPMSSPAVVAALTFSQGTLAAAGAGGSDAPATAVGPNGTPTTSLDLSGTRATEAIPSGAPATSSSSITTPATAADASTAPTPAALATPASSGALPVGHGAQGAPDVAPPPGAPFGGVAYAYAGTNGVGRVGIGNDGSNRASVRNPPSSSFELRSFDIDRVQVNHAGRRGEVVDNVGSSDAIGWGRWIGGAALGGAGGSIRFGVNGGLHYFTGLPTAATDMPKGQATYHFAGATRPTVGHGHIAPGVLENGRMRVDFDRARVGIQFDVRLPAANLSYSVSTAGGTSDVAQSQAQIQGGAFAGAGPLARNGTDCAAGCTTQIAGGFVGPQAAGAGFVYQIRGVVLPAANDATPAGTSTINGAVAFVK